MRDSAASAAELVRWFCVAVLPAVIVVESARTGAATGRAVNTAAAAIARELTVTTKRDFISSSVLGKRSVRSMGKRYAAAARLRVTDITDLRGRTAIS